MSKTYTEKIEERIKWHYLTSEEAPNYIENRAIATRLCSEDPLFFINNFCYTYDPRGKKQPEKHLPFILYRFQEDAIIYIRTHIENEKDMLMDKSRDMGASWIMDATFYWGWRFNGWDLLLGSRKQDLVDKRGDMASLVEKLRYINSKLPKWLRAALKENETDKTMLLVNPVTRNSIAGESNNTYFGTGGRYKAILFDEFPKWADTDATAWRSAGDSTPCRIAVGTPSERGRNCQAFKLIDQGIDRLSLYWVLHPKKNRELYYEREENNKIYLDTSKQEDLDKACKMIEAGIKVGSIWYDKESKRRTSVEIAQELNISYDASLEGAIFEKFDPKRQIVKHDTIKYNSSLPVYVAADFGIDTTSFVWIQYDGYNYRVIDEYEDKGHDISHYIPIIQSKPYGSVTILGDPRSGKSKQVNSSNTVYSQLKHAGFRVKEVVRTSINDRLNASRFILNRTLVSDRCVLFIGMVENWRMKRARENDRPTPDHSIWSHMGEAFGYFALGVNEKQKKYNTRLKSYNSNTGVT